MGLSIILKRARVPSEAHFWGRSQGKRSLLATMPALLQHSARKAG